MWRKITLVYTCCMLWVASAYAQDDYFGLWTSVDASKKFNKFELNGEVELRMRDNMERVARLSGKIGVEYKIIKALNVGVAYQYIHFNDVEYSDFQPRSRFIGYIQGKQKWGNISVSLRERIQTTYKSESDRIKSSGKIDTYKSNPEWIWRNRLKIAYDIPNCKFTPAVSVESFYQLNNPEKNVFENMRYTLACTYKISKKKSIEFFMLYDNEINVNNPEDKYVAGVSYSFSF